MLENLWARYLVDIYFDCRENKTWPSPGSITEQTSYCIELFDFLDTIVGERRMRQHKKMIADTKKSPQR